MPGWSTKSLSSTRLRVKGRKNRKKERKRLADDHAIPLLGIYQLKKNFSFVLQKVGRYLFTSFGGSENAAFDVRRWERTPARERLRHPQI